MRFHLIVSNFLLDEVGQLVYFIHEAPGLVGSVHSVCCCVGNWFLMQKVLLLLDLLRSLSILLPVLFLAVVNFSVTS